MYLDTDVYVDYFTALLHRTPDTRLVADLTPAYGMLPAARLRQVRDDFARRGVRVLPVFLMRDPVDRAWSQVRMHNRLYDDHAAASQDPVEYLLEHHASPAYARRTRYDLTLRTTDEVRRAPPAWARALPGDDEAELVKAAVGGQIGGVEPCIRAHADGSVVHVEVFQVEGVGTSILGRPRRLSADRRADNAVESYTLNCEEPLNMASLRLQWHQVMLDSPAQIGVEIGGG